ncbi:MAG: hypothetical protein ACK5IQ_03465 [Bacteroidales bacterium]
MNTLEQAGVIPMDYAVLRSIYSDYSFPQNKIANLEQEGKVIRLKKGLYVVSPNINNQLLSAELIANHLYGPSYVSMESALRYYGLIPERVYTIRSMTTKRSKKFENSIGNFEYIGIKENYYPIGIKRQMEGSEYAFIIATPEKALCDIISETRGVKIQSAKVLEEYLEDDLRLDTSRLSDMDSSIVEECIKTGKKKRALKLLLKLLR